MFSLIHWNKVCEEKNKLSSDHSSVLLQLEMYLRYFCSHHMNWWTAMWVYLEEVTVAGIWCWHCHWDGSGDRCMSSCVIVFSACARTRAYWRVIISEWKISYQFGSRRHHTVSPSFNGIGDKITCLSQRDNGRGRRAVKDRTVLFDLICYARVFSRVHEKKNVNFRIFDNILNSILA